MTAMPSSKSRPWWLENREPEPLLMPCLDQDEADEWSRLFATATMSMSSSEALLRRKCIENGVPFTPALQQVAATMEASSTENDDIPLLDVQFAQYGGLQAFLDKYCPRGSTSVMSKCPK